MDSSKMYILGAATAAALAGVYVFWGPSHRLKRREGWIKGLQNLGNTCFLNSVLQALAPCTSLNNWIAKYRSPSSILTSALFDILNSLNNEKMSNSSPCPTEVLSALQFRGWLITNEEQDAHELFHVLTTTLEEESNAQQIPGSLLQVNQDVFICPASEQSPGIASRVFGILPSYLTALCKRLVLPTKGLLVCRLICRSCGFGNPLRYDSFDSVSLSLPEHFWGTLTLEQCLKQWAATELVPDVHCLGCSKKARGKKQYSTFTKQLCFGRLPDCLCLHLVRTVWLPTGVPCKRSEHVAFSEYLNFSEYSCLPRKSIVSEPPRIHMGLLGGGNRDSARFMVGVQSEDSASSHLKSIPASCLKMPAFNNLYQLKSVIVHIGDTFSGHFITYRRGSQLDNQKNVWFCVSDMSVRQVTSSEVFKAPAYMLFYEKLEKGSAVIV